MQLILSNYSRPSSNCDWFSGLENFSLHPLTPAHLHIQDSHTWQYSSNLWTVCACIHRCASLLRFILSFPSCICRVTSACWWWKTSRN